MRQEDSRVSVFEYQDYRAFLKDWYQKAKQARGSYSYRAFAKKAGFHSSNFMMLVIQGKRNLTEESLKKFLIGLNLNKQEQEFFRNLVFCNQSETHEDKNFYYQRLMLSKKFSQLKPIEKQQYEYYSTWYHPVIRELVVSRGFDGMAEWISGRLSPTVTPAQVSKSIELLEALGFIQKTGKDRWRQTSTIISTGPDVEAVIVRNYHKSLLGLSREMMDRLSAKDCDASALTLGVRRERLSELRLKIREFRREVLKMVSNDTEPEEVVQLNIQFFPVTKIVE